MARRVQYAALPTERVNPRTRALDRLTLPQLLRTINREDASVPRAVSAVLPQVEAAVSRITASLREGGRLFFVGAGTSGRLGVIEAAECPPTFSTPPSLVQAIIAGGTSAVFRSKEGAEDDRAAGRRAVQQRVRAGDAVVGIAASGVTPFVEAGLQAARTLGASTILVTCNPAVKLKSVDVLLAASVGPEVLAGSTRLKAGTATKLILNMLTVGTMVRLGKVHGNRMVDVRPTSRKLRARAQRLVEDVAGVPPAVAASALRRSEGRTKVAIVMAACRISASDAATLLQQHGGLLRPILERRHAA